MYIFGNDVALSKDVYDPNDFAAGIPGEPSIKPLPATVHEFLTRELYTPVLDDLWPWLWLVARRSGSHIDALHVQAIKGRTIIPAEDPNMHLITQADKVYIKPIPLCLLNQHFWTCHLTTSRSNPSSCVGGAQAHSFHMSMGLNKDGMMAAGFLRSYAFLIRHRLDLSIAVRTDLVPLQCEWAEWSRFAATFRTLSDEVVAQRYNYGQLRLSRLNWATRILRPGVSPSKLFYQIPYWSIHSGIRHLTTPALLVFGALSLMLSAMQVVLSIPLSGSPVLELRPRFATDLYTIGLVSSVAVLTGFVFLTAATVFIPVIVLLWQGKWALKHKRL